MKKIKFPLDLENGVSARTMDELKDNFNLEAVVKRFIDGKLAVWLNDRYYDNEYSKVSELSESDEDLGKKLCEIFGVEYNESEKIDVSNIINSGEKLTALKQYTDSEEVLSNADKTALNQNELLTLLDNGEKTIYLCGESFEIPLDYEDVKYIGVNEPVLTVNSEHPEKFYKNRIVLSGLKMPDEIIRCAQYDEKYKKAEEYYIRHDMDKAMPLIEELCAEHNPRAYSLTYWIYIDKADTNIDAFKYVRPGYEIKDPICSILYALFSHQLADEERQKIYSTMKPLLKEMTNNNDIMARYTLGVCYINETDEPINYAMAVKYFEQGMSDGHYRSIYSLAARYDKGQGVEKDYAKSFELYTKAANMTHACSIYEVAICYGGGYGVEKDEQKAVENYIRSAKYGYTDAESKLGSIYYNGNYGQKVNYDNAFIWDSKAANKGNLNSINRLGICYKEGKGVDKNIELAIEYFKKASDGGDKYGARNLGYLYYEGEDVPKDWDKAKQYLTLAVERGHEGAQEALDVVCGKPVKILNLINKIERIDNKLMAISGGYIRPNIDHHRKFSSRSSAEDYLYSQLSDYAYQLYRNNLTISNSGINDYIVTCQDYINDIFTELNAAFIEMSIDTDGLTAQCQELKRGVRDGIADILNDNYYSDFDVSSDVSRYDLNEDGSGGFFSSGYTIGSASPTNIDRQLDEKKDHFKDSAQAYLKQLLQPLAMELRRICEEIKNNK